MPEGSGKVHKNRLRESKMAKLCQSCGMPMNKDPGQGGIEADGSKSETYCSLCYQNGAFTQELSSAEEMQEFCVKVLSEKGMPKFMAWIFTRGIPKLERWQ